ncbi:MAG: response regulator [Candidatus Cloacimonetes bacterium]|nr:response regulator [Candidatus Cloacimonadota bacterium]
MKILIVEDETLIALNIKRFLERKGYTVLTPVASGEDALNTIQIEHPDVMLLDIRLTGEMTGLDVARKMIDLGEVLNIVFMSGYVTHEVVKEALELKPLDFLEKPIDVHKVVTILSKI